MISWNEVYKFSAFFFLETGWCNGWRKGFGVRLTRILVQTHDIPVGRLYESYLASLIFPHHHKKRMLLTLKDYFENLWHSKRQVWSDYSLLKNPLPSSCYFFVYMTSKTQCTSHTLSGSFPLTPKGKQVTLPLVKASLSQAVEHALSLLASSGSSWLDSFWNVLHVSVWTSHLWEAFPTAPAPGQASSEALLAKCIFHFEHPCPGNAVFNVCLL